MGFFDVKGKEMHLVKTHRKAPALTRAGQQKFWDKQADTYELAGLTKNEAELLLVRGITRFYIDAGYVANDLVTLGGAVGSRDPVVLIDEFAEHATLPGTLYFNDISHCMLKRAIPRLRASYPNVTIVPVLGAMCEAGYDIPVAPRRVIMGVYNARSFVEPCPHYGYTMCGFDEYLESKDHLGPYFEVSSVFFDSHHESVLANVRFTNADSNTHLADIKDFLKECVQARLIDALRVLSWSDQDDSFFISHWFSEVGIRKLVTLAFGNERAKTLSIMPYGKGFLVCIDPLEMPQGVVTVLNNVLGNVLPQEWQGTLRAIADLSE